MYVYIYILFTHINIYIDRGSVLSCATLRINVGTYVYLHVYILVYVYICMCIYTHICMNYINI